MSQFCNAASQWQTSFRRRAIVKKITSPRVPTFCISQIFMQAIWGQVSHVIFLATSLRWNTEIAHFSKEMIESQSRLLTQWILFSYPIVMFPCRIFAFWHCVTLTSQSQMVSRGPLGSSAFFVNNVQSNWKRVSFKAAWQEDYEVPEPLHCGIYWRSYAPKTNPTFVVINLTWGHPLTGDRVPIAASCGGRHYFFARGSSSIRGETARGSLNPMVTWLVDRPWT